MTENKIVERVDIKSLREARELGKNITRFLSADDLIKLAENNIVPHYYMENPLTKEKKLMFYSIELQEWLSTVYVKYKESAFIPSLRFITTQNSYLSESGDKIPEALQNIRNLRKIPLGEAFCLSGVYFLCKENELQYIGQSVSVLTRIQSHISEAVKEFDKAYFIPCPLHCLNEVESVLIKELRPPLNGTGYSHASKLSNHDEILQKLKM